MSTIKILQGEAGLINVDLTSTKEKLNIEKPNLEIDEKSIKAAKEKFEELQKKQKNYIKYYEDDKKRYKVLKKYGEVLQLVEKLFGLLPSDLSNLSTTELEEKLEELLKSRKKNETQMQFVFFQNLLTDLLSNLIIIENNYQEGKISSKEALEDVRKSKEQIKEHSKDFPPILRPTLEEASYLVKMYEQSYSNENELKTKQGAEQLKETDVNPKHQALFAKLNNNTNDLINQVGQISQDLSNFEPHVDMNILTNKLKATEDVLSVENWDVDKLDMAVGDLKSTTISLTDKQVDINKTNEKLEESIKDTTKQADTLSKDAIKEFSIETFEDINNRAQEDKKVTKEIIDILEVDVNLTTTIGTQVANTIISQVAADEEFVDKLATDPNVSTVYLDSSTEEATESAEELKDSVLSLEEKRELLLKLEMKKEETEDGKKE